MIVVDTSAIMAILLNEKQAGQFAQTIEECGLARSRNLPLLYQGDDFARTDIVPPSSTSLGESPRTSRDSSVIHQRSGS